MVEGAVTVAIPLSREARHVPWKSVIKLALVTDAFRSANTDSQIVTSRLSIYEKIATLLHCSIVPSPLVALGDRSLSQRERATMKQFNNRTMKYLAVY